MSPWEEDEPEFVEDVRVGDVEVVLEDWDWEESVELVRKGPRGWSVVEAGHDRVS